MTNIGTLPQFYVLTPAVVSPIPMKQILDILQSSIFQILSAVTALLSFWVLDWPSIWQKLNKGFRVTFWQVALIVIAFVITYMLKETSSQQISPQRTVQDYTLAPSPIERVTGKDFGREYVIIDNKQFYKCNFDGTQLSYRGDGPVYFKDCTMSQPDITFVGNAGRMLAFLAGCYKAESPLAIKMVTDTLLFNLRQGRVLSLPPPDYIRQQYQPTLIMPHLLRPH
ncbi:hypothetical protein ACAW74_25900 [Fibrella sp. WM1]|uniref:hypothetical protein n=1 Tax=Fibrella musci TaxID=3242485 RepID=UPI003520D46C